MRWPEMEDAVAAAVDDALLGNRCHNYRPGRRGTSVRKARASPSAAGGDSLNNIKSLYRKHVL